MSEPDSWEHIAEQPKATVPAQTKLNPSAKPFVFNPNASTWAPPLPKATAPLATPSSVSPPAVSHVLKVAETTSPTFTTTSSSNVAVPVSSSSTSSSSKDPATISSSSGKGQAPSSSKDQAVAKEGISSEKAERARSTSPLEPTKVSGPSSPTELEKEKPEKAEPKKKRKEVKRDSRPHVNVIFIGHVDAGKSTISGHILYLTGMVDDRTLEKYEREAKLKNRETWKYAWAMDISEEEREKGKTHETGTGYFETKNRRFTILDAPGHKAFVPSMIGGACQADIGILVISARKGEFETGFEKGGQTREHAILAKTSGVRHLLIVINKMDDPSVMWDEVRYKECVDKLMPFLKVTGYGKGTFDFMPVAGLSGLNLATRISKETCPWWDGMCLLEYLDSIPVPELSDDEPVRFPVQGKYKDMGLLVHGTNHSGSFYTGDKLLLLPTKKELTVDGILLEGEEVEKCFPGDNVVLRVKNVDEDDIRAGFVMVDPKRPIPVCTLFTAQVLLLECKNIITVGYSCVLHIHALVEECTFQTLLCTLDKKTGDVLKKSPPFVKGGDTVLARIATSQPIALESYKVFSKMGRFMLRDEGKTIAVGVVTKIITEGGGGSTSSASGEKADKK